MAMVYAKVTDSTAIERIGYDTKTHELRVKFRNRDSYPTYAWMRVPQEIVEEWFLVSSKGKYYHAYIKDSGYDLNFQERFIRTGRTRR